MRILLVPLINGRCARLVALDDPSSKDPLYSTFQFCNVLSLLSRRGGGREFGQMKVRQV